MADLARIKRNVAKMVAQNAPETDIDRYIASEGVTVEDVRNFNASLHPLTPEQKAEAARQADDIRPKTDYLKNGLDILGAIGEGGAYAGSRILNGLTLNGSDWLEKKLTGGNSEFERMGREVAENAQNGGKMASFGNTVGNVLAEMGGGMRGAGKLGYDLTQKGISGLGGLLGNNWLRNSTLVPSVLSGGGSAAIYSTFGNDFSHPKKIGKDAMYGTLLSGVLGVAGKALPYASKLFSAKSMTKGMQGGLENAADNPQAVKILNSGISQSDDIAQEFLNKVRPAMRNINQETENMLNGSLTRRVDVPKTVADQKAKYGQFMKEHAADEVMDFAPTREQLINYPAESRFNLPKKNLAPKEAEDILFRKAKESGIEVGGNPEHYTVKGQRGQYVRTLPNTLNNPDITYNQGGREYLAKKYQGVSFDGEKPFFDFIVKENGGLYNKFNTDSKYLDNQIKKAADNVSVSGRILEPKGAGYISPAPKSDNSIPLKGAVVNAELPHFSVLYEGLTPYQSKQLGKAFQAGLEKTNQKAGSLESINRVKQELNDMINKSTYPDPTRPLVRKPESGAADLIEVKKRVDSVLGSALKGRDRGYHKAKQMEKAYDAGLNYNPNSMSTIDLVPELKTLERNAFTQGLFRRMTNNSLEHRNLAENILKYDNALAGVLPRNRYSSLIETLNNQATRFGRLDRLGNLAETKLQKPEASRLFLREQAETPGAAKGAALDWLNRLLRGRAIKKAARNLMDPEFMGQDDNWLMENYPYLANAVSARMKRMTNE